VAGATPSVAPPLLDAQGLGIRFSQGGWLARRLGRARSVQAVDGVSLRIHPGEVLGLVGESGCGKSTLGRLLLRLLPADAGTITFAGQLVPARPGQDFRRRAQIVFQNPDTALNPRQTVATILGRAISWFAIAHGAAATEAVGALLDRVRLPRRYAGRFPHQLSGGEKQRVGIARALASGPAFMVCDEAVSALDVSVQAAILNLVADLRAELGVAILFISHDIGVIAHIADRVAVMYAGSIMEQGRTADVLQPPYHPYTELLLASVPLIGKPHKPPPRGRRDAAPTPAGCKFAARCPRHMGPVCDTVAPPVRDAGPGHGIRCHIPIEMLATVPHWLATQDTTP
jgi:peptide/nickel transport system ATP-binding protein